MCLISFDLISKKELMKFLCKTLIGALSFISINAIANSSNKFDYIGLSYQSNSYNNLNFAPNIDTSKLAPLKYTADSSGTGLRGFLGHQFNTYIAVETGISYYGKAEFSVIETTTNSDATTTNKTIHQGDFSSLTGDFRVIGTYPVSDSLFLKAHVGALLWDSKLSVLVQTPGKLMVNKVSSSGVSLLTGVGIGYGFSKTIAISLDFERTEIAEITSQNLSLSFLIRF